MNEQMSGYRKKMALLGQKMLAEEENNVEADTDINYEIEREKSLKENQHIHNEFE